MIAVHLYVWCWWDSACVYMCVGDGREPCAKQNRMLFLAQIESYEMNNFNK